MKQIVVNFNFPALTAQQYDSVLVETEPLRKTNYPGLLFHVAAPNGAGLFVCDVWESEVHFNAFGAIMLPVLIKMGGTASAPIILPIHNLINDLTKVK